MKGRLKFIIGRSLNISWVWKIFNENCKSFLCYKNLRSRYFVEFKVLNLGGGGGLSSKIGKILLIMSWGEKGEMLEKYFLYFENFGEYL